jgi:hypothetical protein
MEVLVLRLIHILAGMLWVGAGGFNVPFLGPTLARVGPAAGPVMAALRERGMFTFLPAMAVLTILSGTRLMAIVSAGFEESWFASTRRATYAWSGLAAILAFVTRDRDHAPAGEPDGPAGGEMARAADMAVARYLS